MTKLSLSCKEPGAKKKMKELAKARVRERKAFNITETSVFLVAPSGRVAYKEHQVRLRVFTQESLDG